MVLCLCLCCDELPSCPECDPALPYDSWNVPQQSPDTLIAEESGFRKWMDGIGLEMSEKPNITQQQ